MKPSSEARRCEEIHDFHGQNYGVQLSDVSIVPMTELCWLYYKLHALDEVVAENCDTVHKAIKI